ncbi:MAG: hypothetical protein QM765_30615 [Myxococcales bacterium]
MHDVSAPLPRTDQPVSPKRSARGIIGRLLLAAAIVAALAAWGRAVGADDPLFAATAGFTLLGLLELVGYFVRLPAPLGKPRAWEGSSRLYRRLGVTAFGALLRGSPLRHLNLRVYRRAAGGLRELMEAMEEAEASHTIAFAIVGLYSATAALRGWWPAFAALCALNLVANLYPILHLRHCRARLAALTARRPR